MSKKIADLVPEVSINEAELTNIVGGLRAKEMLMDGCVTGICSQQINPAFCEGGAVCTSGIAG